MIIYFMVGFQTRVKVSIHAGTSTCFKSFVQNPSVKVLVFCDVEMECYMLAVTRDTDSTTIIYSLPLWHTKESVSVAQGPAAPSHQVGL
jgi:hypothetical protein